MRISNGSFSATSNLRRISVKCATLKTSSVMRSVARQQMRIVWNTCGGTRHEKKQPIRGRKHTIFDVVAESGEFDEGHATLKLCMTTSEATIEACIAS